MKLLIAVMCLWNLISFLMMGIDKYKANKDKKRISEKTLILSAFLMGGIGIAAGAVVFHHKTKKLKFKILMPLSIIFNGAVIYGLYCLNLL